MPQEIDWILMYIRRIATAEEKERIKQALEVVSITPVNQQFIIERVIQLAGEQYRAGHKLNAVKITKDMTGWGLKECKDWCDQTFG